MRVDLTRQTMRAVEQSDHDLDLDFRYELVVMIHRIFAHVTTAPDVTVTDPTTVTLTWPLPDGAVRLTFHQERDHYEVEAITGPETVTWVIGSDWGDEHVFETVTGLLTGP